MQAAVRHRPRDQPVEPACASARRNQAHLEHALDLDRRVDRQRGDADRGARMPALVAEHRDHEVGGAVHHLGAVEEGRRGIDEAAEANHPLDLVEIAERRLDLRQHVDRAGARRLLAVLDRYAVAELALGDELAARIEADLAGDEQQRADPHERDVIGDGRGRGGKHDPEFRKFLFDRSGHDVLLGCYGAFGADRLLWAACLRRSGAGHASRPRVSKRGPALGRVWLRAAR